MNDAAIEVLEALRDQWALRAGLLERLYGDSEPAAAAYRECIRDLYAGIQDARTASTVSPAKEP